MTTTTTTTQPNDAFLETAASNGVPEEKATAIADAPSELLLDEPHSTSFLLDKKQQQQTEQHQHANDDDQKEQEEAEAVNADAEDDHTNYGSFPTEQHQPQHSTTTTGDDNNKAATATKPEELEDEKDDDDALTAEPSSEEDLLQDEPQSTAAFELLSSSSDERDKRRNDIAALPPSTTTTTTTGTAPPNNDNDNNNNRGNHSNRVPYSDSAVSSSSSSVSCSSWLTLCRRQVWGVVVQIFTSKYRTPVATCMELFTPVLMMLVLVAAYQLSNVEYREAEQYATFDLELPGPWIDLATELVQLRTDWNVTDWTSVVNSSDGRERERRRTQQAQAVVEMLERLNERYAGPLDEDDEDETLLAQRPSLSLFPWSDNEYDASIDKFQLWRLPLLEGQQQQQQQELLEWDAFPESKYVDSRNDSDDVGTSQRPGRRRRHLQIEDEDDDDDDAIVFDEDTDLYGLINQAHGQVRQLLRNPLFVPTLSQYVTVSRALSRLFDVDQLPRLFTDSSFGRQWGNLLTLGTVHLSPRGSHATQAFERYLREMHPLLFVEHALHLETHESEKAALEHIDQTHNVNRTWVLLDFSKFYLSNNNNPDKDRFHFAIRMNYTTLPNTNEITNFVSIGLNKAYQRYYLSGYLTWQRTLNEFAVHYVTQNQHEQDVRKLDPFLAGTLLENETVCESFAETSVWSMPMPTASYSQNSFYLAVGYLLGLTIAMAYLYPTSRLIKSLVEEKELKLKETLLIMGLKPGAHWLAWTLSSLIIFFVIAVLVTLTLSGNVLMHSNPSYLFWWIFFFSTATMGFCFTLAALFSKAKLAAIVGPMALFATLLPRFIFFGYNRYEASTAKKIASLLPATAFSFGADIVADYEYSEVGIQSWNAGEGEYSFNTSVGFLLLDTLLYVFLGWYLDQVVPREYGSPRPFWFIVSPSFWCGCCFPGILRNVFHKNIVQSVGSSSLTAEVVHHHNEDEEGSHLSEPNPQEGTDDEEDHEPIRDSSLIPRVLATELTKVFGRGKKTKTKAVDHLNLTLYESQITTLLGHNGAGKTTTISLLTGLFRPSGGDATIYGNSIVHNADAARRSIGICPQQNVLFDHLTVKEHCFLYMRIKGKRPSVEVAQAMAEEIGLQEFFHVASSALSGGNKRKLCVAAALCGDPRFLVLDEPTSGMDPTARRKTWDVLRRLRVGRTILLCTHFMDEAEILSDRIAIMKTGKLRCSGSPLFLKQRFGVGYNFTAVLELANVVGDDQDDEDLEDGNGSNRSDDIISQTHDTSAETAAATLLTFTQSHIPESKIQRIGGKEITIRIPTNKEESFPELFNELEAQRGSMKIGAFGVENASLEEVFIQLADDDDDDEGEDVDETDQSNDSPHSDEHSLSTSNSHSSGPTETRPKTASFTRQIRLLYWKRFVYQRRDPKGLFFAIVVPVLLVALVLLILTINVPVVGPSIEVSPSLYETSNVGDDAVTDVVVGGGIASSRANLVKSIYEQLSNWSQSSFSHLNFDFRPNLTSSRAMSQMMLDSINEFEHNERYGAYALKDTLEIDIEVDWRELSDQLDELLTQLNASESIDLLALAEEALGRNDSSWTLELNTSVREILETTGFLNETVSVSLPTDLVNASLAEIFSTTNVSRTQLEEEVGQIMDDRFTVASLLNDFTDWWGNSSNTTLFQVLNQTLFDELEMELLATNFTLNASVVAEGWGAVVSSISREYLGSELGWLSREFQDTIENIIGNSDAAAVIAVWAMTLLSNEIEDNGELKLVLSEENLADWLGVDLNERYIWEIGVSSLKIHPSENVASVSGLFITLNNETYLEDEDFNISLSSLSFDESNRTYQFNVDTESSILHNASSPHAVAAFNQHFHEFLFRKCTGRTEARVVSENHPLPLTTQQSLEIKTMLSILASMFILIPYCFIPGAFCVFLVREKASKSKHLQLVSGTDLTAYWVSSYLFDVSRFVILTFLVMMVFLMYGKDAAQVFVGTSEAFWCTTLLTLGYGLSILPFSYLLARRFENHSSAQIAVIGLVFITGFVAVNAYFIMDSIEKTKDIAKALRPLFRLWPAYNVGDGLISLSRAFWEREVLFQDKNPFDWDVAGKPLSLLYLLILPYAIILLFVEFSGDQQAGGPLGRLLRNIGRRSEKLSLRCFGVKEDDGALLLDDGLVDNGANLDSDVLEEEAFVGENNADGLKDSYPIVFQDLWKVYPPSVGVFSAFVGSLKRLLRRLCCFCCRRRRRETDVLEQRAQQPKRAVRGMSTAIRKGEIYALLGANGAGKSTTLGMLTGDVAPTRGKMYVAGYDATGQQDLHGVLKARKNTGFCPQVDPLLDLMTVRETLVLFGSLRGIPRNEINTVVEGLLRKLMLGPHEQKTCQSLSGGNKRKLSLGIALIGDPSVLLIDESSSGLDPLAKRRMWNLIASVSKDKTVILTTHSMEEAEALCTRAGIMANGQLLCLGSVQHLKTKYLDGYTIDVFCLASSTDEEVDHVVHEILEQALPGSSLAERHGRFLRIDFPNVSSVGLGTTFGNLEALKRGPDSVVESYSIAQCSLEQVFVQLSNQAMATDSDENLIDPQSDNVPTSSAGSLVLRDEIP